MRGVDSNGNANLSDSVDFTHGVRPVFNLKAEVLTYGDGTMNNPYRLTENIDSTTSSGSSSTTVGGGTAGVGADPDGSITVPPAPAPGGDGADIQ